MNGPETLCQESVRYLRVDGEHRTPGETFQAILTDFLTQARD